MIGHEKQKAMFEAAIKNGKLSHAYVLTGPEHVGKTTFAREVAASLGCHPVLDTTIFDLEEARPLTPEPARHTRTAVADGRSDGGRGMTIEQARELQHILNLTSATGKYKVAIVSYADRMTHEAANAILKFLENPPPRTIIFLITANFYGLLPTVASRLVRVNFARLSDEEVRTVVSDEVIVELAAGCIGLARRLQANPQELNFFLAARQDYKTLETGQTHERLLAAQKFYDLESGELARLFAFWMGEWAARPLDTALARRLQVAFTDLRYNLNVKLLLDNLFLK